MPLYQYEADTCKGSNRSADFVVIFLWDTRQIFVAFAGDLLESAWICVVQYVF